ncbi:hypothetical protein [Neobacillus ginsengisoli]|uniref:Uncharacterized protein n=1 Tax=Neobacillus ginsengisoli TaxID=904295 RepID=A0ABT9XWE0_9BACI|nr:hypothetical protein [Neobacillus ginsengisoli]MDQ0199894.1 hypothetical protein [Neobacillus ginsengisoli]
MLSQQQQTEEIQYIPPKGEFEIFRDEEHYREKMKEWGLSATKEVKKEFWYKDKTIQRLVTIKGYETFGLKTEFNTLVIEFQDGNLSCIHPAYLKEMQQASFGKESIWGEEDKGSEKSEPILEVHKKEPEEAMVANPKKVKEPKPKKERPAKVELPEEKVHFTGKVKQFAMTYNPFNEENDEVVVLEDVVIVKESPLELKYAWCSHSKTLKKFELAAGDLLEFDGKVAAKKLAKGKDVPEEFVIDVAVAYKINNPSKIVKL